MRLYNRITSILEKLQFKITTRLILTSSFILIAVIPALIINSIYYGKERGYIIKRLEEYNLQTINKVGEQLDFTLSQVDTINYEMVAMANEYNILNINFKNLTSSNLEKMRLYESMIQNIRRTFPAISDAYFINLSGYVYSSIWSSDKEKLLKKDWIVKYKPTNQWTIIPTHKADYYDLSSRIQTQVVSFLKPVLGGSNYDSPYGIIQIDIKLEQIEKLIKSTATDGDSQIYLSEEENQIIYCSDDLYLGKKLEDALPFDLQLKNESEDRRIQYFGDTMVIIKKLPNVNWHIIKVVSTKERLSEIEDAKKIVLFITLLAMLFSLVIGMGLSSAITKPLKKLMKLMNRMKVDEATLEPIQFHTLNNDLNVLSESYNIMVDKINILMKNIVQKEQEKKDTELQMLQSQISPHFLYNTLNMIKWMALMENSHSIADAIVSLVNLLEFSCKNHNSIIPIKDEVKMLKDYIDIQNLRYNSSINVVFDLENGLQDLYMLKFTLQPSIENAMIHAFSIMKEEATIYIRGWVIEDQIIFEVEDNGIGMDDYTLRNMTGLGVKNVNDRIKLHFGDEFGQVIKSQYEMGTKVIITLPKLLKDEG